MAKSKTDRKRKVRKNIPIIAAVMLLAFGGGLRLVVGNSIAQPKAADIKKQTEIKNETQNENLPKITIEKVERETDKAEDNAKVDEKTDKKKVKATAAKPLSFSMPIEGKICKDFCVDKLIYSATYGDMRTHDGVDIEAESGALVKAAAKGTVFKAYSDAIWGNTVIIDHGNGIYTYYCGLGDISVKEGAKIPAKKIIGSVGASPAESLDTSHLHFAMKKAGVFVSPLKEIG